MSDLSRCLETLKPRLTEQHRMHPKLAEFPSCHFYQAPSDQRGLDLILICQGKLTTAVLSSSRPLVKAPRRETCKHSPQGIDWPCGVPLKFIDMCDSEEQSCGTSWKNESEAAKVLQLYHEALKGMAPADIGLVTPYAAQVQEVKRRLPKGHCEALSSATCGSPAGELCGWLPRKREGPHQKKKEEVTYPYIYTI